MKKTLPCCLLATSLLPAAGFAQTVTFSKVGLDGGQEAPPNVGSAASGVATLTLNETQTSLTIQITLVGIDIDGNQTADPNDDLTAAHIHRAPAGVNGPVVFGFVGPNSDVDGDLVIDPVAGTITSVWDGAEGEGTTLAAELASLLNRGLYFNIHTQGSPAGEIRGQIVPVFPTITAPRKVKFKRRNAKFRVSVEADLAVNLGAKAGRGAKANVKGDGPFLVKVRKPKRRVTKVKISATDTDGQNATKTTKVVKK